LSELASEPNQMPFLDEFSTEMQSNIQTCVLVHAKRDRQPLRRVLQYAR